MSASHSTGPALLREPPPSAANQREKILALLREAARSLQGVSGDTLRYDFDIRQAPTRIFELKNEHGYRIETVQDPGSRLATYFLRGEPPEGWYPPAKQARFRLLNSPTSAAPPLTPQPEIPWEQRQRVATDLQGRPLSPADAGPLFARVRQ